ncbi:hypothetical protein O7614_22030 [Micromonospora sp. WMMD961]|uniref:hypothetical protein n=1 Tax=Micromonospora sp. WMMD961 TaxID=3016100 RepID=UPI0024174959|nr:hypothetical protein [Micromonospora sp. WMMD961]MDG4782345.1 hypothetical protein [Micromonospora sp. WMMD961]
MADGIGRLPLRGAEVGLRLAWGGLLLLSPVRLLRPVDPVTTTAVVTLRVLGARHIVQTAVTLWRPTPGVFAGGAAVDAIHCVAALALAAVDSRQRSAARTDAAVAAAWAVLGAAVARDRGDR